MTKFTIGRRAWLQIFIFLAFLVLLGACGIYVYGVHQRATMRIEEVESKYARLLGLIQHGQDVKLNAEQVAGQLERVAYPASQDITQAGNDAQQRLRTVFADSKLDIVSIQVLPAKEDGPFDRIPLTLRIEGELIGIQNALTALSAQTPSVQFDTLTIQTIGAVKPASIQRLGGQFTFFVLRMRS